VPKPKIAVLLLSLLASAANAQDGSFNPGWETVSSEQTIEVRKDGSFTREAASTVLVTHPRALSFIGQRRFVFSESMQKHEVLEAYTLKKTGEKLPVAPASMFTRSEALAGNLNAPIFDDRRVTTVVFPNVEVGDRLYSRTRLTQTTPYFPGYFSAALFFIQQAIWRDVKVSLSAPADFPLVVKTSLIEEQRPVLSGGKRTWTWRFANHTARIVEPQAVNVTLSQPYILASSFKDYGELAAAYKARARDKSVVTPEIQKLADELTAGLSDKREQTKRLYQWVARNVRYVAMALGDGGYVPHDAASVLANRYGDCKDHVVLLEALLAAKGIDSTAVLIDTRPNYELPGVPILAAFNHAINYIPSLDLYVDSTNRHAPFGVLPLADSDKPVIHAAAYKGIQRTAPTGASNVIRSKTTLALAEDGSASGELRLETQDITAINMRALTSVIAPANTGDFVAQNLAKNGIAGSGTMAWSDDLETGRHSITVSYKTSNFLNTAGPSAFAMQPALAVLPSLHSTMQTTVSSTERKTPYGCASLTVSEEYEIAVPETIKVVALPSGLTKEALDISYRSTYQLDGKTVRVTRKVESKPGANICTAERFNELRLFFQAVNADLKSQVLYQPAARY